MEVRNSRYAEEVAAVFRDAVFIRDLGIVLAGVGPGWCKAEVEVVAGHRQHLGRVHGGVLSSLAGHAALGAALSVAAAGDVLVAPEFNFRLFRAVASGRLLARATVIKSGALLIFVDADVYLEHAEQELLVARGSYTFTRAG